MHTKVNNFGHMRTFENGKGFMITYLKKQHYGTSDY
jgi:hypothetical protein